MKKISDISTLSKEELVVEVLELQHRLSLLEKMIFGPKNERFLPTPVDKNQLSLDMEVETIQQPEVKVTPIAAHERVVKKNKERIHPGRNPLPANLRREVVTEEPEEDVTGLVRIGEEISEVLEIKAAELYVVRTIRPTYARKDGSGIVIAKSKKNPIEKGIAGPSILAMIILSKFIDHLPIHRQIAIFKRWGVELKYNTVLDWSNESIKLLLPLYELLKKKVFESGYLQADETTLKVLDNEKKGRTHQGYLWAYRSCSEKLIFFEYQPGRGKTGPAELLKKFSGFLQTDGYSAYDQFALRNDIQILNCMAHARRYFKDAENNDLERASFALTEIQKLYAIEREIKELSSEEKLRIRQQQAVPILKELNEWMIKNYQQVTPKSAIGKALEYSMTRWKELGRYTSDGKLMIDNNLIENDIRPIALGRKNYLFAGSHQAAQRIAIIYSLLGTCKAHDINPQEWLTHVFKQIPYRTVNKLEDLLPQNFKSNM